METPSPVSLSPALISILAKSKQVMNKIETDKPIVTSNSTTTESIHESTQYAPETYNESDERDPAYEYAPRPAQVTPLQNFSKEHIMASNLPQAVKEAMIKNPIAKVSMTAISDEDIKKINPNAGARPQQQQQQPRLVNEVVNHTTTNSDLITVSKSQLQGMIDEGISRFFKQVYDKTLTEETIKKTINLLIKEGKITVKKKTL